ncbi:hypothetical protein [Yersinia kristensenii]|uniref:hypothetical protein n=1 Tax=Yersinia kristensenii TaxID=28152 RepID=UPI00067C5D4A|nr:hypothetical protein [Yersinia kristensenii]
MLTLQWLISYQMLIVEIIQLDKKPDRKTLIFFNIYPLARLDDLFKMECCPLISAAKNQRF